MDYKEIIKERIKILPDELRDFILDENWRKDVEKIGKEFSLSEEEYASLENEIFLVLLCFEPQNSFVENIKNELKIDSDTAGWIAEDVGKEIFKQVSDEINSMWQTEGAVSTVSTEEKSSGVGNSFEQIILNQAKAMRPAVPPENLPIEQSEPKVIHNYISESDPYREPAE